METRDIVALARQKQNHRESLYVLLDGACDHSALRHIFSLEGVVAYLSLYLGTPFESVMESGPVLVEPSPPSPFLSWFWEQGPAVHAGIALFSPLPLDVLAGQLRELLTVTLPTGTEMLFRFYDPRLVRTAMAITVQNGCMALRKNISALYSPRYIFGQTPQWEQLAVTEQSHG